MINMRSDEVCDSLNRHLLRPACMCAKQTFSMFVFGPLVPYHRLPTVVDNTVTGCEANLDYTSMYGKLGH
jgi:hypothetical protein